MSCCQAAVLIKRRRQWKKKKGKYLFNKEAMAKVFRARFLAALNEAGLSIPKSVPSKWVVDCAHVGKGITALKYLSRYLYRGVISEKNIVSNQNGHVTFKYVKAVPAKHNYRTVKGKDFLCSWFCNMFCQKAFAGSEIMAFFMATQKSCCRWSKWFCMLLLKVIELRPRPAFKCPCCKSPMAIIEISSNCMGTRIALF